ncbi:MAG TPA: hypothetical protein VIL78_00650 [Hanamia sp.]
MTKSELDKSLKQDAASNGFSVDGDYLIFDRTSNLSYMVLPGFSLGDLLTANPVSLTRLNKNLLVVLNNIAEKFALPIHIRASYHSPEYNLLSFGCLDSELYTKGDALSVGVEPDSLDAFNDIVKSVFKTGETGYYKWGVHLGWSKEVKDWDKRFDDSFIQKVKDLITNDKLKNIILIGGAAAAVWFFLLRKK